MRVLTPEEALAQQRTQNSNSDDVTDPMSGMDTNGRFIGHGDGNRDHFFRRSRNNRRPSLDTGDLPDHDASMNMESHFDMYRWRPQPWTRPAPLPPLRVFGEFQPGVPFHPSMLRPRVTRPRKRLGRPDGFFDVYLPTSQIIQDQARNRVSPNNRRRRSNQPDREQEFGQRFNIFRPDHRFDRAANNNTFGGFENDQVFRDEFRLNPHDNHRDFSLRLRPERRRFNMQLLRIEGNSLRLTRTRCRRTRSSFIKDYIVINPEKVNFCFNLYRRFLNFDINLFQGYMPLIKDIISSIGDHKKAFYCSLCDAHQQIHFDETEQLIYYSNDYCRNTLNTFRDYFTFMNIIYIEYIDSILQYIQCYESDALVFEFPFQNFLVKYKQRIPFWKACLDSLESDFFINNCWSICNKFSQFSRSSLIEGNIDFFQRTTSTIFSFLRKVRIENPFFNDTHNFNITYAARMTLNLNLTTTGNVNGLMYEPLGPAMLITNNRYFMADDSLHLLEAQQFPNTNLTDRDQMRLALDDMLTDIQLGTLQSLIDYGQKVIGFRRFGFELNQHFLRNEDKRVSNVNGLINQLFKLRTISQMTPGMVPSRFLRKETFKIMNKFGLPPKEYVRMLKLTSKKKERKLNFNPRRPFQNQRIIPNHNHTLIHSYGVPLNVTNPPVLVVHPPWHFWEEQEKNIEVYPKIENSTDLKFFGITFDDDGLDPLANFESANYYYNITRLIGQQFSRTEKIEADVIKAFILCGAENINKFNFVGDEITLSMGQMTGKYVGLGKISMMDSILKVIMPSVNTSLALMTEIKFRNKMGEMLHWHKKNEGLEEKEIRMREIYKLNQIAKDKERDNHPPVNNHFFLYFDDLFNGIADIFISLFGE